MKKLLILLIFLVTTLTNAQWGWSWWMDDGVKADTTPPDSVTNLSAIARMQWQINRTGTIVLSWTAETDTNVRRRIIYRGTSPNPTDSIATVSKNVNTYIDSGITSAIYYYRIRSEDWAGNRSGYSQNASDTVYEFETSRYLNALTTPLTDSTKWKINTFVYQLKNAFGIDSLTQKAKVIYLLANETSEAALRNLVERDNDAIAVGSPTFTAFRRFTTASGKYLNTTFNPYTADSSGYRRFSCSQGIYSRTATLANVVDCGAGSNFIAAGYGDGTIISRIQSSGSIFKYGITSAAGFTLNNRTSHTLSSIYQNYVVDTTKNNNSEAVANKIFVIGGYNYADAPTINVIYPSSRQYGFYWLGLGLTNAEVASLTYCVEVHWMDANYAGVIASSYYKTNDGKYYASSNNQYVSIN